MVAKEDRNTGVAASRNPRQQFIFWIILGAFSLGSCVGIVITAGQQLALQRDFSLFSEHAMATAFHLQRLSLRIAELGADDFSPLSTAEKKSRLESYRITITAQYANVTSGYLDYFTFLLGDDVPEAVGAILDGQARLRSSIPLLLEGLRRAEAPETDLEGDEYFDSLGPLILSSLRDSRRLNDGIRRAEALTFSVLKGSLERSGLAAFITIAIFSLISVGSLFTLALSVKSGKVREKALREAKDSAERLLEREREFLANTSHELRTPVSGLLGMANLLAEEELPETAAAYSRNILSAAEDLAYLIGNVLDSQTESAALWKPNEWMPIAPLVEPILARCGGNAKAKGLEFTFDDRTEGREIFCAAASLRSVFSSILSNAVKFTDIGSIHVRIGWEGDALVVDIRDTGIGMDPATLARATERFFQGENSSTKRHRGLGLGLWTAERIIGAVGGHLRIDSEAGKGTAVRIELPLRTRTAVVSGESAPAADTDNAPVSILVAEDDAISRMLLEIQLAKAGYNVISAVDGNKAMEAVSDGGFNLAILDISMPYRSGIDVVKHIREREREQGKESVPVFALTGHSTADYRQECMSAGFDEFITKPFNNLFLMETIQRALSSQT